MRFLAGAGGCLVASIDLPVTYLCGAAFFGDDRDMLYTWGGVPRISGDLQRRIGPLMFHVIGSVPTGRQTSGGLTFQRREGERRPGVRGGRPSVVRSTRPVPGRADPG